MKNTLLTWTWYELSFHQRAEVRGDKKDFSVRPGPILNKCGSFSYKSARRDILYEFVRASNRFSNQLIPIPQPGNQHRRPTARIKYYYLFLTAFSIHSILINVCEDEVTHDNSIAKKPAVVLIICLKLGLQPLRL